MKIRTILSTLTVAATLGTASPALTEDSMNNPANSANQPDTATFCRCVDDSCQCTTERVAINSSQPQGATIEGQIAAVEPETGRFILDTEAGLLPMNASPGELAGIHEGDIVTVSLAMYDND